VRKRRPSLVRAELCRKLCRKSRRQQLCRITRRSLGSATPRDIQRSLFDTGRPGSTHVARAPAAGIQPLGPSPRLVSTSRNRGRLSPIYASSNEQFALCVHSAAPRVAQDFALRESLVRAMAMLDARSRLRGAARCHAAMRADQSNSRARHLARDADRSVSSALLAGLVERRVRVE
jgi:hypothetical protein